MIRALAADLRAGRTTATALVEARLARIAALDPTLHSFIHVTQARARAEAAAADRLLAEGVDLGPLHGIPYAVKDIIDVAGAPTTCNARLEPSGPARHDAPMIARLSAAGAVCLGKLATHEYALGGPSPDCPYPPARNPWDPERFTGASSSGSGAAVAAGLAVFALGSDTSGSVRGPASLCGVSGVKPSFGLVSRRGMFPLSWALDHVGVLAERVEDCAHVLDVVAGHDPDDPASVARAIAFHGPAPAEPARLRIGVVRGHLERAPTMDPAVATAIEAAIGLCEGAGIAVEDVALPAFELFDACGRVLMTAEAYAIHARAIAEAPEGFGRYTYQRVAPGAFLTAADYVDAQRLRAELVAASRPRLAGLDAVIYPGSLHPAPLLSAFTRDWPPPPALTATRTIVANVLGAPAASLPTGLSPEGLPLGMQLMGAPMADRRLLDAARWLQEALATAGTWPFPKPMIAASLNHESTSDRRSEAGAIPA
ncbi:amidase [Salinarimonas sp.]|uniref:amidase n=1 Tax=Salinarimonas sp. TaxID=2766526 RepID=UPI0032D996BB